MPNSLSSALLAVVLLGARLAPSLLGLPWFAPAPLALPTRLAVVLSVAMALVPGFAPAMSAPGAWVLVALARELCLGVALLVVLATPLVALRSVGAALDGMRSGASLARWTESVGAMAFLAAGAPRGVLRALAGSFALVPLAIDDRAPWALASTVPAVIAWAGRSLEAMVLLGSAGLFALSAVELSVALAGRVHPAVAGAAVPLRATVPLGVLGATLPWLVHGGTELMSRALTAAGSLGR